MEKTRFSRRTVLAAVPVVGGAAFVAACGTAQVAAPMEEKAAPEEKAEAAPAPAEEVQLTYLSRDSDSATLKVRALFDKYEAANPNITIAIQNMSSGDEAKTKLLVQAASGVPIDFLRTSWGSFADLIEGEILSPLDDFFKADGLVPSEHFLPNSLTHWTVDGLLYGWPGSGNCDAVLLNKTILDKAGLEPPPIDPTDASWNMDKFLEYARAMTQGNEQFGHNGGVSASDGRRGHQRGAYFGQIAWDYERNVAVMDHPKFIEGLAYWVDLKLKHRVVPSAEEADSLGATNTGRRAIWETGKVGMNITNGYRQVPFEAIGATLPFSADVNISGRSWFPAILIGFSLHPDETWAVNRWMMEPEPNTEFTLAMGHTISAVQTAVNMPAEQLKATLGFDAIAHAEQVKFSPPSSYGMNGYPTWGEVGAALRPHFDAYDAGQITPEEYGRVATDIVNELLIPKE